MLCRQAWELGSRPQAGCGLRDARSRPCWHVANATAKTNAII